MLARNVGKHASWALSKPRFTSFCRPVSTAAEHINGIDSSSVASAKPFEEIPGFKMLPVIGSAWIYFPFFGKYSMQKLHEADADKHRRFGNIVREKVSHLNLVSCYTLEDLMTVLQHEGKYPDRGEISTLEEYRKLRKEWYKTPGIVVLKGKDWYDLRSKSQPYVMKPKLIHTFLGSMQNISQELVQRILYIRQQNNEVENLLPELYKWALESIGAVALDARFGCLDNNLDPNSEAFKLINCVQTMLYCMNKLEASNGNVPWWKYLPSPTWNKFVRVSDQFTQTSLKYINRALEELQKDKSEEKELTLLQSLLRTPNLDISGVMTTTMDLLFGGIDTTSHTEAFMLYELAKNPEKQEKLHEEIKGVLPSPTDRLTPTSLNELRYLKSCMKESIRLHPIIRGLARTLDHEVVLSGYRIPANVAIFLGLQTMNRMEKYYKEADQYIPERWLDKENKPHPYLFVPFGIGMRSCLGRRLAEQEMLCVTVEIIRNFRLEYTGEDIGMITRMVSVPDKPLKFRFISRT